MAKRVAEHKAYSQKRSPGAAFGVADAGTNLWNNREGETPGTEIPMHDDEPIVMGEATMDSSSDSESEDESPADEKAHEETIAKAEAQSL